MPYIIFYAIVLIISCVTMCVAISHRFKQSNFYYPLMFLMMGISNGGYLALSISQDLEKALLANKIFDIAGCFLMTLVFFCVLELCHIKLPFAVRMILISISMGIYFLDLSVGHSTLFFATQSIVTRDNFTHLEYTVGPLYFLFPLQLIAYTIAVTTLICYSFRHRKTVSYKNLAYLLGMIVCTIGIYISRMFLHYEMNFIPLAYAIDGIILISLLKRLGLYDISTAIGQSQYILDTTGYILFDENKAFLTKNNIACNFYPELEQAHVDYVLPNLIEKFAQLNEWMHELDASEESAATHLVTRDDREIKCLISRVLLDTFGRKQIMGYMISISDVTDERRYLNLMTKYNEELRRDVEAETRHVKEVQEKLILGMANMIENRDNSTGGHIKRTSKCMAIIAEELKRRDTTGLVTDQFCAALIKAAPMHDIGKIAVDDDILKKPGKFTDEEYEQMKEHAQKGSELLRSIIEDVEDLSFIRIAENIAHYHHERWNGTGYPTKLSGNDIPLEARVMALADVYDALVSERCYKEKLSFEEAAKIIREGMGTHFDPALADVFEACREQLEEYYRKDEA